MREVFSVCCFLAAGFLVPWSIIRWDLQRLDDKRKARAWTDTSFLAAVLAFGPLAVVVHFIKTRANLFGIALGIALATLAFVLIAAAGELFHWLMDLWAR